MTVGYTTESLARVLASVFHGVLTSIPMQLSYPTTLVYILTGVHT